MDLRFHNAPRRLPADVLRELFLRGQRFANPDNFLVLLFMFSFTITLWEACLASLSNVSDFKARSLFLPRLMHGDIAALNYLNYLGDLIQMVPGMLVRTPFNAPESG